MADCFFIAGTTALGFSATDVMALAGAAIIALLAVFLTEVRLFGDDVFTVIFLTADLFTAFAAFLAGAIFLGVDFPFVEEVFTTFLAGATFFLLVFAFFTVVAFFFFVIVFFVVLLFFVTVILTSLFKKFQVSGSSVRLNPDF